MHRLGDLTAVARALPREHRSCVSRIDRVLTGSIEAPVAVEQQGSRQLRKAQAEKGEYEQLVPEDVTAIGLAVQPSGGNADVETDGVVRHRLQEMEDLQVKYLREGAVVAELDAASFPDVAPAHDVTVEQVVETASQTLHSLGSFLAWLRDRRVA